MGDGGRDSRIIVEFTARLPGPSKFPGSRLVASLLWRAGNGTDGAGAVDPTRRRQLKQAGRMWRFWRRTGWLTGYRNRRLIRTSSAAVANSLRKEVLINRFRKAARFAGVRHRAENVLGGWWLIKMESGRPQALEAFTASVSSVGRCRTDRPQAHSWHLARLQFPREGRLGREAGTRGRKREAWKRPRRGSRPAEKRVPQLLRTSWNSAGTR